MSQLVLVRHGKSAWDSPALADHERPLKPRGEDDSARLGEWMLEQGWLPDRVLCSPARRTRQTWELMSTAWPRLPPVEYDAALYLGERVTLVAAVQGALAEGAQRVMLIGHNPGISDLLIQYLRPDGTGREMKTAHCAVLELAHEGEARPGEGTRLLAYWSPRGED
jgi:phosphohistidine phosphatase